MRFASLPFTLQLYSATFSLVCLWIDKGCPPLARSLASVCYPTKKCAYDGASFGRKMTRRQITIRSAAPTTLPTNRPVNISTVLSGYVDLSRPATTRDLCILSELTKAEASKDTLKHIWKARWRRYMQDDSASSTFSKDIPTSISPSPLSSSSSEAIASAYTRIPCHRLSTSRVLR